MFPRRTTFVKWVGRKNVTERNEGFLILGIIKNWFTIEFQGRVEVRALLLDTATIRQVSVEIGRRSSNPATPRV